MHGSSGVDHWRPTHKALTHCLKGADTVLHVLREQVAQHRTVAHRTAPAHQRVVSQLLWREEQLAALAKQTQIHTHVKAAQFSPVRFRTVVFRLSRDYRSIKNKK